MKLISKEEMDQAIIPPGGMTIWTHSHQHSMFIHSPLPMNNGWICNGLAFFGQCLSGLTDFDQSENIPGWACRECDFDLCFKCLRLSLAIDRVLDIARMHGFFKIKKTVDMSLSWMEEEIQE